MEAVKKILRSNGYETGEEMETGGSVTVEVSGFMDLVIEKIGENRLSVAHYYTQMGDLMADPEIVFHIDNGEWVPVRYTEHPRIHRHAETGLPGLEQFINQWNQALKRQGHVEAAQQNEGVKKEQ